MRFCGIVEFFFFNLKDGVCFDIAFSWKLNVKMVKERGKQISLEINLHVQITFNDAGVIYQS